MKMKLLLILCFGFLPLFVPAQMRSGVKPPTCPRPVDARLRDYFDGAMIAPSVILNNQTDSGKRESNSTTIPLPGHRIEWINVWTKDDLATSIRIDGKVISFKGIKTTNIVDESGKGDLEMVEEWREAKLYQIDGHDIIGIAMGPGMCTGLMCSVSFQLIHDAKTKTTTLFGSFRTDQEVHLYRFGNEHKVFYVSTSYFGDPNGATPVVTEYDPFELSADGHLREYRSKNGSKYWLKHSYYEFDFEKPQTLGQHWFEKIK